MTAAGGAAPAVIMRTPRRSPALVSAGACSIMFMTMGAPQRCVTPWSEMAPKMEPASTRRRHTCVPPSAVTVHGKHQPLQWNIGSVQR
jgi:hypothetical protein